VCGWGWSDVRWLGGILRRVVVVVVVVVVWGEGVGKVDEWFWAV
jgi:hypothetical protein